MIDILYGDANILIIALQFQSIQMNLHINMNFFSRLWFDDDVRLYEETRWNAMQNIMATMKRCLRERDQ